MSTQWYYTTRGLIIKQHSLRYCIILLTYRPRYFVEFTLLNWPFNRQIVQFEFSPTWSCVSRHLKLCLADAIHNFKWVKIIQIWQNGGQLFSNLAGWCHIFYL